MVGGLVLLAIASVVGYFSDYERALCAVREVGGATDADRMDDGPVTVRRVQLAGPAITDAEIERVAPHLSHLPELFTLDLSMLRVTDRSLGQLRGLNNLGDILLRYTKVTDEGLEFLAGWDKLWTLDLMHTRVRDRGLAMIGKNHPALRVLTGPRWDGHHGRGIDPSPILEPSRMACSLPHRDYRSGVERFAGTTAAPDARPEWHARYGRWLEAPWRVRSTSARWPWSARP